MKQDMILILDLGSEENPKIAREIRALGVYTEIHPHDITAEELAKLPGVKGIILNGGVNRVVDGVEIDASEAVYNEACCLIYLYRSLADLYGNLLDRLNGLFRCIHTCDNLD